MERGKGRRDVRKTAILASAVVAGLALGCGIAYLETRNSDNPSAVNCDNTSRVSFASAQKAGTLVVTMEGKGGSLAAVLNILESSGAYTYTLNGKENNSQLELAPHAADGSSNPDAVVNLGSSANWTIDVQPHTEHIESTTVVITPHCA